MRGRGGQSDARVSPHDNEGVGCQARLHRLSVEGPSRNRRHDSSRRSRGLGPEGQALRWLGTKQVAGDQLDELFGGFGDNPRTQRPAHTSAVEHCIHLAEDETRRDCADVSSYLIMAYITRFRVDVVPHGDMAFAGNLAGGLPNQGCIQPLEEQFRETIDPRVVLTRVDKRPVGRRGGSHCGSFGGSMTCQVPSGSATGRDAVGQQFRSWAKAI